MSATIAPPIRIREPWITTVAHLGIVCLIAVVTWWPRFGGSIDLRFDAGAYYELGAGLAQGDGYRMISEPGKPEGLQYPPALPHIVAGHIWLLGTSEAEVVGAALRRTYFGFSLGLGILTWILVRRHLPAPWATAASAMVLLHAHTLMLSDLLFAEIPSAVCILLFVLLNRRDGAAPSWAREAAVYAVAVVGFLLRTANIALLGAWVVEALLHREWKRGLIRGLLAALPVLAWQAHVRQVAHSPDYLQPAYAYQRANYHYHNVPYAENMKLIDPFRPEEGIVTSGLLVRRVLNNAWQMPGFWGGSATVNKGYWYVAIKSVLKSHSLSLGLALACVTLLGLLAAGGLGRLALHGHWSLLLVLSMITLPVCLTPWTGQYQRYLMPVTPILVLGLLFAARELILAGERRLAPKRNLVRGMGWAAAAVLGTVQVAGANNVFSTSGRLPPEISAGTTWLFYDATWERWERAVAWIRERAPADAVVATTAPQLCHLRTGLLSVMPPMEIDTTEVFRLMDTVPVSYAVIDEIKYPDTSRRYVKPAMLAHGTEWKLVYEDRKTQVYQRMADAPTGNGGVSP